MEEAFVYDLKKKSQSFIHQGLGSHVFDFFSFELDAKVPASQSFIHQGLGSHLTLPIPTTMGRLEVLTRSQSFIHQGLGSHQRTKVSFSPDGSIIRRNPLFIKA